MSPDNNDDTAANMWRLLRDAGVERACNVVTWNVVPWYLGDGKRIRDPNSSDLQESQKPLRDLLGLLRSCKLLAVVLLGKKAKEGWSDADVDSGLPVRKAPHPSPQNLNTKPGKREEIRQGLDGGSTRRGAHLSRGSL